MRVSVLIADDHAVFRSGLKALLEKEDDLLVVGEAGDGAQTLEALRGVHVDVLLLDISMPGLSGPKVAEAALRDHPKLAIVVLTMHEDAFYLHEMFKLGVRGFVLKKSTSTDVIQAIRAVHAGNQYVDPVMAGPLISSFIGRADRGSRDPLMLLTSREQEVCRLLALGHTNAEIGEKLFISERTVETHRMNIMAKLEIKSRAELVRFAIDKGMLKLE